VFDVMSARSNGSVRRLKSFGIRSATNGSAQTRRVPGARCSMNTTFQLSKRRPTRSPSSLK
jgi:hypothetical protein